MKSSRLALGALASAALFAALFGPKVSAARAPVYAITKAKVVTVSGAVLENATLVFQDGVITDIGTSAIVPKEARVIDGTGMTVTPGLIDAFSGFGIPATRTGGGGGGGGASTAASPAPNPVSPAANTYDRVRATEALRARDSGVTTIVPIPRDGMIHGSASVLDLVGDRPEAMVVKADIALAASLTPLGQRYPGSLMGVMAYLRQALMDGAYHRNEVAVYEKSPLGKKHPTYDPGLDVWANVASGSTPLLLQTTRIGDIRRAFGLADEFKIKIVLAGNTQAFEEAALLKERKAAILVSVNFDPPRAGGFGGGGGGFGGNVDDDLERATIEKAERNPAALDKEGVKFGLVSGFANDFLAGVRRAIERGLPRETALRAVTLTPAEILGVSDRMGSLEKGKIANAVVWSGDPLTREARVKMVFVDGELYEPDERPAGFGGRGGGAPPGNTGADFGDPRQGGKN